MAEYVNKEEVLEHCEALPKLYREAMRLFIEEIPSVNIVRCKECKHRIVNEHYGEKGYIKLKAMCELDTGDIFQLGRHAEDDEWYCADGEREGE